MLSLATADCGWMVLTAAVPSGDTPAVGCLRARRRHGDINCFGFFFIALYLVGHSITLSARANSASGTSLREVERYTRAADQERMARIGMAALIKGRDVG
jgi:hypothetical protein